MIEISQHGPDRAKQWGVSLNGYAFYLGSGDTPEAALIDAEKFTRTVLDDVQAKLTTERERLKGQARA